MNQSRDDISFEINVDRIREKADSYSHHALKYQSVSSAGSNDSSSTTATTRKKITGFTSMRNQLRYWLIDRHSLWFIVWIMIQAALFAYYYVRYGFSPLYRTIRGVLGPGLPVARGAAGVLLFNCSVIYLSMCRQTMTFLSRFAFIRNFFCFDAHRKIHMWIAISILVFTVVHVGAHISNILSFVRNTPRTTFLGTFYTSGPGYTGNLALFCLLVITIGSSFKTVINKKFEFLAYSHYFMFPFAGFLLVHGLFCFIPRDDQERCDGPRYWKFSVFPLSLYIIERVYFEIMSRIRVKIHRIIRHRSNILEIRFTHKQIFGESSYNFRPGQYLLLNCPEISWFQWHPFTITSAPEDPYVSVHIKACGDWTNQLVEKMESAHSILQSLWHIGEGSLMTENIIPTVLASRAIFAPADQVFNYPVSVLIGCGVGMTPYYSILRAIKNRIRHPAGPRFLKSVYFIWVCRDIEEFECLVYFLRQLEREGLDSIVKITLFWTVKHIRPSMCLDIHLKSKQNRDPITGLRAVTHFGRPRWNSIFSKVATAHASEEKVGVFFCGPNQLSNDLMKICSENSHPGKPRLDFYPEIFM